MRRTALALLALVGAGACSSDGREMQSPEPDQTLSIVTTSTVEVPTVPAAEAPTPGSGSFTLVGPFSDDAVIDVQHTCDGDNVPPNLRWFDLPSGTAELALVVTDITDGGRIIWALAGIDPASPVLDGANLGLGTVVFTNDAGVPGWTGPCSPDGTPHSYLFELHALDQQIELPSGSPARDAIVGIDAATLAVASLAGRYP